MLTTEYAKICNSQINSSRFKVELIENNKSTKFFKLFFDTGIITKHYCLHSIVVKFYSKKN